ncbi:MAG: tetratricopeptide repeat protein, partial [Betaproteobacteria bacterium]
SARPAEAPAAVAATPAIEKPTSASPAKASPAEAGTAARAPRPHAKAPAPARPLLLTKGSGSGSSPLEAAYAALLDGRLEVAAEGYRRALAQNAEERDALLGIAYIAHRQGRRDEARIYYERVLRLEPENAVANSGMLAILAEGDPAVAASRAREITEKNPGSAAAFATLGNILVREGNFAEAQQAFFRAATLEPGSAFHAYNLAVALDRLHKSDLAANYYTRALALGEKPGQQAFPKETARQRLEQLRAARN